MKTGEGSNKIYFLCYCLLENARLGTDVLNWDNSGLGFAIDFLLILLSLFSQSLQSCVRDQR